MTSQDNKLTGHWMLPQKSVQHRREGKGAFKYIQVKHMRVREGGYTGGRTEIGQNRRNYKNQITYTADQNPHNNNNKKKAIGNSVFSIAASASCFLFVI